MEVYAALGFRVAQEGLVMPVHDHKGLENIKEKDRCPTCEGAGWVRYIKNKQRRSHPCLDCGGNGIAKESK